MTMTNDPNPSKKPLEFDDQTYAELDAQVFRELASGQIVPDDPDDLIDDGPDPLGIDFAWAGATVPTKPAEAPQPPVSPAVEIAKPARIPRRVAYGVGAALAASLLIAVAALVTGRFRDRGPETIELALKPTKIEFFGAEQPRPSLDNCPMDGFVAAVAVTRAGDVRVWPTEGDLPGAPVWVRKGDPLRVGPLTNQVEVVAVVVSEQPATATLLQEFGRAKVTNEQRSELAQRITALLRSQNYRNLAVGLVEYRIDP